LALRELRRRQLRRDFLSQVNHKQEHVSLVITSAKIPPKGNKREDSPRVQKQDKTMHPLPNVIFDKVLV
jgi:hypothetical protein